MLFYQKQHKFATTFLQFHHCVIYSTRKVFFFFRIFSVYDFGVLCKSITYKRRRKRV